MSSACDHREIVRSIYRDAARRDFKSVQLHLADDCVIHEAESLPYGGRYVGSSGFIDVMTRLLQVWNSFQFEPHEFLADGDHVVVLLTATGNSVKTGTAFSMPLAEVWRFSDRQVVELYPFYWDTHALCLLDQ
jgi:uncharacterized protein